MITENNQQLEAIRKSAYEITKKRFEDIKLPVTHRGYFCFPSVSIDSDTQNISVNLEFVACETIGLKAIYRDFQEFMNRMRFDKMLTKLNQYTLNNQCNYLSEKALKEERDNQLSYIDNGDCCEDIQISYTHTVVYSLGANQ